MHLLDTITITIVGLMVGNELALSAFVNPERQNTIRSPSCAVLAGWVALI
jgi:hypothetical protein